MSKDIEKASETEPSTALYKELFVKAADGLHILNDKGDVVYCSQSFAELLGYSHEEALQLNVTDWDRHFPTHEIIQVIRELIENPQVFETKHLKKNGEIFYAEISARGIELNGELYLYASSRDISKKLRLEQEIETHKEKASISEANLLNEKSKFQNVFENSPDALMVMELDGGNIALCNTATEKMLRGTKDKIVGLTPNQLSPEMQACGNPSLDLVPMKIESVIKNGHHRFEWIHTRFDGEEFPCDVNISLIDYENRKALLVGWRDITELKYQEQKLAEANRELEQFTYRTSHDLKAPLVTIRGLAKYIEEDLESGDLSEVTKNAKRISKHAKKLEKLVVDILDLTKADLADYEYEDVNLREILLDIQEIHSNLLNEKQVNLIIEVDENLKILTQRTRLQQILSNLISNAVKYSDQNKDSRFVHINSSLDDNVYITIADNGVGIMEKDQAKLFDMFSRFSPDLADGSGLGMSIVKKNVDALKGEITLSSTKEGTSFQIKLPVK